MTDSTAPLGTACARCGGAHAASEACPPPAPPGKTLAFGTPAPDPSPAAGAAEPRDPLVGARVGSFEIVRMIGRGGMGNVYLAEHPAIGSRVAIKFLHESMAASPEVVGRFYDEARAVNLIGHENIVAIYDLNVLPPGRYYFVMEYLDGETLASRLAKGRVERASALDVLVQLTDALQCAHGRGVVHRDLKPENVFLVRRRGKDFAKLVDFGIAKLRDGAGGPSRTAAGYIVGTPEYMAPEQCDVGPIDARTDVYALGVMAYELLTGRLPFAGRSVPQLLLAHLQQAPPAPRTLEPSLDAGLERTLLRALAKRPEDRFPDMASLGAELSAAIERERARGGAAAPAAAPSPSVIGESPACPLPRQAGETARADPGTVAGGGVTTAPASITAEVRAGEAAPRTLAVADLTRSGLFLRDGDPPPPLRSRVRIALAHPALPAPVDLDGEVVRHVSPADAAAWRLAPGYAVQLLDVQPEARAAIASLVDGAREPARAAPPAPGAGSAARLAELEGRTGTSHYLLLDVAPDAEFAEIRRAGKALSAELEAIRTAAAEPDHPARAGRLLARLDAALHALAVPAQRLGYDAQRGNHRGVARCLSAGIPAALVTARRREFLASHPDRAAEAQRQLARAQVARKLGNAGAAAVAYEAALAADPLDLAAQEAFQAFRRENP